MIPDPFERTVRIPVQWIDGQWQLIGGGKLPEPKSVPRTDAGRDTLIGGLVDRGFLEKHPSDHQQVWKLGSNAPSLAPTAAERQALDETKAIFQKSIDTGDNLASCKEGVTDAKPGLVSIA